MVLLSQQGVFMIDTILGYFKTNVRNLIAVGLVTLVGTFAAPQLPLLKDVCVDVVARIPAE